MTLDELKNRFNEKFPKGSKVRSTVGVVLIVVGLLALVTPFTPGSWLAFVGLGLLGIRISYWERIKERYRAYKDRNKKSL